MLLETVVLSPVSELSYSYSKAESFIVGLERVLNENVLKLICSRTSADLQLRWREEVVDLLGRIAEIRLRPDHDPAPSSFYFRLLFEDPYGSAAETNVACFLRRIGRQLRMSDFVEIEQVAIRLRQFHAAFADLAASGLNLADRDDERLITNLVATL